MLQSLTTNQLKEASESLATKTEEITELEIKLQTLTTSLEAAQSDAQAKQAAVGQLEQARASSEAELADLKKTLAKLRAEETSGVLAAVQEQVRVVNITQDGPISKRYQYS